MNDSEKDKHKQKLVEAGLMEPVETLGDVLQASYAEHLPLKLGYWIYYPIHPWQL